ncbi:hypothetical protein FB45DRAFT_915794 [Roridomyces roridus]|uniref:Uncharacterized protein n=1 Tax=Roridomyces roridus TaxID=1738132 RepID=A0AAD7BUQ1_9AGAR|nr:hypothetical protein FB45DRAFT_915794 [Roridomyces roridus]
MADSDASTLARLAALSPPKESIHDRPVIAVDLDDVLCQTNLLVARWHNEHFGTQMDLSHFYYYYYWKNPWWGTPKETHLKVTDFYKTDRIFHAEIVPGAREGIQALRDMGYNLVIVTARSPEVADASWQWVEKYFPGAFAHLVFTGQFKDAHKLHHNEILTNLSKAQVCADLKAQVLIDDSAENAIQCSTALSPTRVLLFGDYAWNQRISKAGDGDDSMSFDRRLAACGGKEFWKEESLMVPEGVPLERVKDWSEVVRWVENARKEGKIV